MAKPSTTIWVVTTGEDADYGVDVLFTTEALAREHAALCGGAVAGSFPLYDHAPPQATVYRRHGFVTRDGRLQNDRYDEDLPWEYGVPGDGFAPLMGAYTVDWHIYVFGTDLDSVPQAYAAQVAKAQARRRQRVAAPRKKRSA